MKRILDPDFKYVPSHETDLKKRFAQIRRQQKEERERIEKEQAEKLRHIRRTA